MLKRYCRIGKPVRLDKVPHEVHESAHGIRRWLICRVGSFFPESRLADIPETLNGCGRFLSVVAKVQRHVGLPVWFTRRHEDAKA